MKFETGKSNLLFILYATLVLYISNEKNAKMESLALLGRVLLSLRAEGHSKCTKDTIVSQLWVESNVQVMSDSPILKALLLAVQVYC